MEPTPRPTDDREPWAALAETHSAVVFFAGDRAYKRKKPVRFDFLDFSTPERREEALRRELELNRRLAPDVYLGVADLVLGADVVDRFLVMRRLPAARRLARLVRAGAAVDNEVRTIARTVAAFHAGAATGPAIAAVGAPDRVTAKLEADLADLGAFAKRVVAADTVERAATLGRRYLAGRTPLLETRIREGWVRDGHGDLLADDIFCLPDGPRILDCLDFADELRCGDVLADVAFLAMDLERLGAPELADRFLRWYDEYSGERHPASLADYYVAARALVRAKVAAIRVEQQGDDTARPEAVRLLDLAVAHLRRGRVALVLVGGAPGTGKSTLAAGLAERRGWAVVRSDVVRKELAGLRPAERAEPGSRADLYGAEATDRTYAELLARARVALGLGQTVVLDASWTRAGFRAAAAEVAASTASDLVALRCDTPPSVAEERLRRRAAAGRDASDAGPEVGALLRAAAEPWPEAVTVDTSGRPAAALERALAAVDAPA